MDIIWQELSAGLPDSQQLTRVLIRLIAAACLGALIGIQREKMGKPAGWRTHTLVCLGTALFVLTCRSAGMNDDHLARVIQGIITGIGFIGAGAILKREAERDIQGLTTAAGIWMTSAIGVAVGVGSLGIALMSTFMTLLVLGCERALSSTKAKPHSEE